MEMMPRKKMPITITVNAGAAKSRVVMPVGISSSPIFSKISSVLNKNDTTLSERVPKPIAHGIAIIAQFLNADSMSLEALSLLPTAIAEEMAGMALMPNVYINGGTRLNKGYTIEVYVP